MIARLASFALAAIVTVAALWVLATPEVIAALRPAVAGANWWVLAFAVLLTGAVQWLRAWRFALMTSGDLGIPEARLFGIACQLNFLNFVLPFRLGELSYPMMMRRAYGQPLLQGTGVLLLARLFDLFTVAALLLALAAWLGLAGPLEPLIWIAALALAAVPALVVLLGRAAQPLVLAIRGFERIGTSLGAGFDTLRTPSARLAVLTLSFAIWLALGGVAILCANAVADQISPAVAMLGGAAGNLAFALPINGIAGLGPAQAAWVAAVTRAGVSWEDAVVTALTLHAAVLSGAILFGGLALLFGRSPALPLRPNRQTGAVSGIAER